MDINKEEFTNKIKKLIYNKTNNNTGLVFVCIGTDRMTGDSFGPLVGTKLKNKFEQYNICNIDIYGTLENNISYSNIQFVKKNIEQRHRNSCIIAIDSALSNKENIGKIFTKEGKLELGKGLNKKKIEIGDISIKGVVGKNYILPQYNFNALQNASLNEVIKLSDVVVDSITDAIKYIYKYV